LNDPRLSSQSLPRFWVLIESASFPIEIHSHHARFIERISEDRERLLTEELARRIGAKVLVTRESLRLYARGNHPEAIRPSKIVELAKAA
jgi:hypothetical protein